MSKVIQAIADTISQKPEVGVFGSMVGVALSPITIISLITAVLGLLIAAITLVIKVMDVIEKIKQKQKHGDGVQDKDVIIDNKRYRHIPDEDEE